MACCLVFPLLKVISVISVLLIIVKLYFKLTAGRDRSYTCMVGKTVLITGANTGLGFVHALEMAKRGARVIVACRNKEKAEETKRRVMEATNNKNIVTGVVDLSSLQSVRDFAKHINETEERLDVLVNNAGAGFLGDYRTSDGLDIVMQTNHFSPFLLTILLIDLLKKSSPSRIVNVSSLAAKHAKLDVNDLNKSERMIVYPNSKLCNILFTQELARRLSGTNVTTFSVHPGAVKTEFLRNITGIFRQILEIISHIAYKNAEEGTQTQIYVSAAKGIEHLSGRHFSDCQVVDDYSTAKVPGLARKVWEESVKLVKLTDDEKNLLP